MLSKPISIHLTPKSLLIFGFVVATIAGAGYGTYRAHQFYKFSQWQGSEIARLSSEIEKTKNDLDQATGQNESLTKEKETLTNQKRTAEQTAQNAKNDAQEAKDFANFTAQVGLFMAEKFGELDTILLEYDRQSSVTVQWFIENGYFDEPRDADYVYQSWLKKAEDLADEYAAIKYELEQLGDL